MNESDPDLRPIPRELFSEYEERPFHCCTRCGESLADYPGGYRVSKLFQRGEVVFEYALCYDCMDRLMQESSEESIRRLSAFQTENLRPGVQGTSECGLCPTPRSALKNREFALVAICLGPRLMESHLVCQDCMDRMSDLISEQTRDEWNRFVDENFPGVPADFVPAPSGSPKEPHLH